MIKKSIIINNKKIKYTNLKIIVIKKNSLNQIKKTIKIKIKIKNIQRLSKKKQKQKQNKLLLFIIIIIIDNKHLP